jgi:hypothetical protein
MQKRENEEKRVPLTTGTANKLEKMAKAEGISPNEKAAKTIREKMGHKDPETAEEKPIWPREAFINEYKFLHLNGEVAKAFGVVKGKKVAVLVDFKDGALIIKRKV